MIGEKNQSVEKNKSEIKDLVETAELLLTTRGDYQKMLDVIALRALKASGADRVCLIMKNERDELKIESGLPKDAHGIGQKITIDIGETFLRRIIKREESIVLVTNPYEDPRVAYMRGLVRTYGISSILFLPLFFEDEPIGILVFDRIGSERFSREALEKIKLLGRLASTAIGMELKRQKDRQKILTDEKLRTLGEHSSRIAHIIRNSLTIIGGFSGRLLKYLLKESRSGESKIDSRLLDTLWGTAKIIDGETKKLEGIVNHILTFMSFKKPVMEKHNINKFLKDELTLSPANGIKTRLKLDKQLDRLNMIFDRKMLSICLHDLIRNAIEASATRIIIKSKLKPRQKEVIISIINDGKRISPEIMKDLFSPFVTTKMDGNGLGLANVQSIVKSHGGDISVTSDVLTEFKIILPLHKTFGSKNNGESENSL
ncbi:MAG: GAF domain-containing protein [Nitrospirae bacterium]|nr:GAF domain-containing protein [Nitrospirota bacterium]